jgi:hypothetical protein
MIMAFRRVQRKIERTPEQLAELRAVREKFPRDERSLEDLVASGDYEGPFSHGDVMAFLSAIVELKRERERLGLTLAQVSARSGLDTGMLSRRVSGAGETRHGPKGRRRTSSRPSGGVRLDEPRRGPVQEGPGGGPASQE